jgi:hypothetical protein
MLHVLEAPLARATKDLDFLGRLDNSLEDLEGVVREVCTADVVPDGMVFDPATVKTERIKEDADYEGVRVRFVGLLGTARVTMQLDRRVRRRCHAPRGRHHLPGAARLPRARALGLPARDRDRREVPGDGLPAHVEQPHEGLLRRVVDHRLAPLDRRLDIRSARRVPFRTTRPARSVRYRGSRTSATTPRPRCSAGSTRWAPVRPVAPNTRIFLIDPPRAAAGRPRRDRASSRETTPRRRSRQA